MCSLWVSQCVRNRQLMCDRSWTGHAIETPAHNSTFGPRRLVEFCDGLRSTFPKIGRKFDAHSLFLSMIQRTNRRGSRTRLQINACETVHFHPTRCNLAHLLTRHGSPTIYRCFALPQLLYRWRDEPPKFWMPPFKNLFAFSVTLSVAYHKCPC